jgi:hypothetical protein
MMSGAREVKGEAVNQGFYGEGWLSGIVVERAQIMCMKLSVN